MAPLISTTIHQHWSEYIFSETKNSSLFLSILSWKMVKSWFCLFACLAVDSTCRLLLNKWISAHEMHYSPVWYFQTSDICECKILCELCELCVPVLLFLCHFTLVYRRWAKKPKRKMGRKLCLFHQPGQGWLFFFVKETFWLNVKIVSYISLFNPLTPRSSL